MKLPYRKNAVIKRTKIIDYLLSLTHADGKSKAKFFRGIGFNETNIEHFENALLKIGKSYEVVKIDEEKAEFAIKYTIDGLLDAPNGKKYKVRTGWAVKANSKT